MCRNLKPLFNFDPPATEEEIYSASIQFVRKISGFSKPSKANEEIFNEVVSDTTKIVEKLLDGLLTSAKPKNREAEIQKARTKFQKRLDSLKSI
ncbi:MAG: DUF2277 domain-containing protein [Candidatus Kariarchaeaceae archaeon]